MAKPKLRSTEEKYQTLPLFELRKLSISKLKFDPDAMMDTLVRYKEKGSYAGHAENNAEANVRNIAKNLNLTCESGDLQELVTNAATLKRTMDFIIPNKQNPRILAESSFLVTTSSGQGDKSKTENKSVSYSNSIIQMHSLSAL